MLPEHHHEHDSKWIMEQLRKIPVRYWERTAKSYSEVYKNGTRAQANTRLRKYVEKILDMTR